MRRVSLAAAVLIIFAAVAAAAPIPCTDGTNNVLSLNPDGCTLDNVLFSNFGVSDNVPGMDYVIGINGPLSGGPDRLLRFTVSPATPPPGGVDILLVYRVSGLNGVDILLGSFSGNASVTEVVCAVQPEAGICPGQSVIVRLAATPSSPSVDATFPYVAPVWIIKDINIPDRATMSDFANSHYVPEPVTLSLIGGGLVALGLLRRRLKK